MKLDEMARPGDGNRRRVMVRKIRAADIAALKQALANLCCYSHNLYNVNVKGMYPTRRLEQYMKHNSIVERLAAKAIGLGVGTLVVEYKDGCEEVFALKNGAGYGIARFNSSSPEAASLRDELHGVARRKRRITVGGCEYELRGRVYESFGENAFRVEFRRVEKTAQ